MPSSNNKKSAFPGQKKSAARFMKSRYGLLAGSLLLYAGMAQGAEKNAALSENVYLDEMPVVLSVSRLSQPIDEAPAAVTVIDRQMIKDSGAWDLSEVFRLVPGMYVAYHSAPDYAVDSTVSYHGLTNAYAQRMQVLVDGRSVYSPLFGGMLWSDIPLAMDDIERIEVIRGPDSASYGANSFMGVINIITRHSAETQGKFVSLSAGRSRDEAVARYGGKNGDLTYRLTAGIRNDQGETAKMANPLTTQGRWDENLLDDKKIHLLTFRADYRVNPIDELEIQFGYNGGDRQEGSPGGNVIAVNKRADNHFELMHWRRALKNNGELSVKFYHATESSFSSMLDTSNGNTVNADVIANRYDLEIQHTFSPGESTRAVWGGSVRYDKTYAPFWLAGDTQAKPFHLSRLFGNLEWRAQPALVFNLGTMVEDNSFTGTDVTPRVAVNWHFLPGHTLRIGRSKATRTPTVYEEKWRQYYNSVFPNKFPYDERPERIDSREIGYLGKFQNLNVDFRLFHDQISDLISTNPITGVLGGEINTGNATIKGFETQLQWNIGERTRLIYGLSHTQVTSKDENGVSYTNSVPTNSQSLMLTHRFDHGLSASLTGYQNGETHSPGTDSGPTPEQAPVYYINTYRRWDGRLAYNFHSGTSNGELALIVQNFADSHYFEYRHDNEPPGRTAWLNLKLDFWP